MSGIPVSVVLRFVRDVPGSDRWGTLDSNVRSDVIEVRSSESRDNRIRSDTPLRVDLDVLMLGRVVVPELRVVLNRELVLELDTLLGLE